MEDKIIISKDKTYTWEEVVKYGSQCYDEGYAEGAEKTRREHELFVELSSVLTGNFPRLIDYIETIANYICIIESDIYSESYSNFIEQNIKQLEKFIDESQIEQIRNVVYKYTKNERLKSYRNYVFSENRDSFDRMLELVEKYKESKNRFHANLAFELAKPFVKDISLLASIGHSISFMKDFLSEIDSTLWDYIEESKNYNWCDPFYDEFWLNYFGYKS